MTAVAPVWFSLPVLAAPSGDYVIEITDSNAAGSREVIVDYKYVGSGDILEQQIEVINKTTNAYAIKLQKAEATGNDALLDSLTFTFTGDDGKITLSVMDFNKTDWSSFFSLNGKENGHFTLTTAVGQLTNAQQESFCSIHYTFEVVYLGEYPEPDVKGPPTGDNSHFNLYLALMASALISLIFAAFFNGYKKKKERKR